MTASQLYFSTSAARAARCFCTGACKSGGVCPALASLPPKPLKAVGTAEQTTVYLAGPITGKTMDEAKAWRTYAAGHLEAAGIRCLSPLRGKEHLAGVGPLPNDFDGGFEAVTQDLDDIAHADAVLAYFGDAEVASIGTCCEIGFAHAEPRTQHIVAVVPEDNVHDHVFIKYMATDVVHTLDEGITIIKEVLNA